MNEKVIQSIQNKPSQKYKFSDKIKNSLSTVIKISNERKLRENYSDPLSTGNISHASQGSSDVPDLLQSWDQSANHTR